MKNYILVILVFFPMIMGVINYFVNKRNRKRDITAIIVSILELIFMFYVAFAYPIENEVLGFSFKADGFRAIYAIICGFMWTCTLIFSRQYMLFYDKKDRYYLFNLLTLGATVGVFYSNNLWTTFLFFELMSLTSFVLVVHEETKEAIKAAATYLIIAIISGMILLMGMFLIQGELDTLDFESIYQMCKEGISRKTYTGGVLLLIGFGAKAGMFPLHIWLPKAHPVAPAPASALLSGILTKTGVFGIIICVTCIFQTVKSFAILLLILAMITMLLGAVLAVFSIDLKRTLACSSMSQIGFILTGLAMMIFLQSENILAFEGSFLHMVNHSLIKLSLFMIAGVVYMNVHRLDLNEIRGFGRKKRLLMVCFAFAALSLMGIPLFGGYISKTLIHESIVEYCHLLSSSSLFLMKLVEYAFLFAGGLTIAYMLKLFVCIFIEKNNDEEMQRMFDRERRFMSLPTTIVVVLSSFILPLLGCIPQYTSHYLMKLSSSFFKIEEELTFIPYFSLKNMSGAFISIGIGLLVYFLFVRFVLIKKDAKGRQFYVNRWPSWLDMENLIYRPMVFRIKDKNSLNFISYGIIFLVRSLSELMDGCIYFVKRFILRQYKYQFDSSPFTYKLGRILDHYKKTEKPYYSYRLLEGHLIIKDVQDTLNSTFAFDFLMACIGLVVALLCVLL